MLPYEPEGHLALDGTDVLIASGEGDPYSSPEQVARLAEILSEAGATVTATTEPGAGHGLTQGDLLRLARWVRGLTALTNRGRYSVQAVGGARRHPPEHRGQRLQLGASTGGQRTPAAPTRSASAGPTRINSSPAGVSRASTARASSLHGSRLIRPRASSVPASRDTRLRLSPAALASADRRRHRSGAAPSRASSSRLGEAQAVARVELGVQQPRQLLVGLQQADPRLRMNARPCGDAVVADEIGGWRRGDGHAISRQSSGGAC